MDLDKDMIIEIIHFLKDNHQDEIIDVIETKDKGLYIIDENMISFSIQAKLLLNIHEDMTIDTFYNRINLQDRVKLFNILDNKKDVNKPYQIVYRYHVNQEKQIWIKEHGIFSYKNKKQRVALITNYTNQIERDKDLHRLAYYDTITNLKNRNYFNKDINFLVKYKVPFAMLLLDINSYKFINDNSHYINGDYILKHFSDKLIKSLRDVHDFDCYRFADDKFSIVFPYIDKIKDTNRIVNNIFQEFISPIFLEQCNITVTPNVGIVFFPKDGKQVSTLLKYADFCLYCAKNDSMHNFSYFNKVLYKSVVEERKIENYIEDIIKSKQVKLKYQPIFNIHKEKIVCLEALFYPDLTYNTDKIFKTAVKSHLIVLLECNILKKVMQDISVYKDKFLEEICFTINITPITLQNIDIYQELKILLNQYQIDGKRIAIEITEQCFVDDETKLNELIDKLHTLGIKIYLDDFGMGYSSVRNLAYITYDKIKLDKRLIQTVFSNQKCDIFIKNMIQFSIEVGNDIIIEGIETEEQFKYIKDIGGTFIQGYYISKPIELEKVVDLIKK